MSGIIGSVWLECEGWTYPNALLEFRHGREAVGAEMVWWGQGGGFVGERCRLDEL